MNSEPNIWHNRQYHYDKLFPWLVSLLIIIGGGLTYALLQKESVSSKAASNDTNVVNSLIDSVNSTNPIVSQAAPVQSLINLNTATVAELDTLNGIGPKKAQQIVALRMEGKIHSVADLQKVKGIGPKLYNEIKDQLVWQ